MNVLNTFEARVAGIFGATQQGQVPPFSFKKLAKKALRELKNETLVIDGIDTAPALFTILIASDDDQQMRMLYEEISFELSQLIEAHCIQKNVALVGKPLIRFMVDPSLRRGKFAVFTENIDAAALERLRTEEQVFLQGGSSAMRRGRGARDGRANRTSRGLLGGREVRGVGSASAPMPVAAPSPAGTPMPVSAGVPAPLPDDSAIGLDVLPASETNNPVVLGAPGVGAPGVAMGAAAVAHNAANVLSDANAALNNAPLNDAGVGVVAAGVAASMSVPPAFPEVPQPQQAQQLPQNHTVRRDTPAAHRPHRGPASAAVPQALLINRLSGKTYLIQSPGATIGRESASAMIVLPDPNVSRSHAQIRYEAGAWHMRDLNSTNGTQVNDVDINECILRSGDFITFGVTTLEFREDA